MTVFPVSTAVVEKAPGKVTVADTVRVKATITGIDAKTRDITLKAADAKVILGKAAEKVGEVASFDELKA